MRQSRVCASRPGRQGHKPACAQSSQDGRSTERIGLTVIVWGGHSCPPTLHVCGGHPCPSVVTLCDNLHCPPSRATVSATHDQLPDQKQYACPLAGRSQSASIAG